jgi:hypothetical protein
MFILFIANEGFAVNKAVAQKNAASLITTGTLVNEMIDFDHLANYPDTTHKTIQFSSYDRRSTAPYAPEWFANHDGFGGEPIPNFLEVLEQPDSNGIGRYLVAQVNGPGVIVHTEAATAGFGGELTVWLDDSPKRLYQGDPEKFSIDRYRCFAQMLGLPDEKTEGFHHYAACYFPVPFSKSIRIEFEGDVKKPHFYNIQIRLYPVGTAVKTFTLQDLVTYKKEITETLSVLQTKGQTWKPKSTGTAKNISTKIQPGREIELFSLNGSRAVQTLTLKVNAPNIKKALRQIILRGYFDNASSPQIESPIGDFFGSGPGITPFTSMPMIVSQDGTMTCRFLMPFKSSAKFVIENFGTESAQITGNVSTRNYDWKENSSLYFFAKWRVDHNLVTRPIFDMPFLIARGKGLYVGTAIMLYNSSSIPTGAGNWWGEGDEKIWVDDDTFPSVFGTGSEEYFNYAWGIPHMFQYAYCASPLCTGPFSRGFTANNRWHIADPILFEKHIDFYMELFHHSKTADLSYARIAYFYATKDLRDDHIPITPADVRQGLEHIAWQPLAEAGAKNAIFYQTEDVLEQDNQNIKIVPEPACAGGKMVVWSPESAEQTLKMKINIEKTTNYEILMTTSLTPRSGRFSLSIDDKKMTPTIDLYTPYRFEMLRNFSFAGPETNKTIELNQGQHVFTLTAKPKNTKSNGRDIGVDFIWLIPK